MIRHLLSAAALAALLVGSAYAQKPANVSDAVWAQATQACVARGVGMGATNANATAWCGAHDNGCVGRGVKMGYDPATAAGWCDRHRNG